MAKILVAALLSLALAAGVAACGSSDDDDASGAGTTTASVPGQIVGAGSIAQELAQELWIEEFGRAGESVPISYEPVGSEEGRRRFIEGEVAFAGSDTPLEGKELSEALARCGSGELIELPVYISAITIFANLRLTAMELSPQTLAKIFNGEITRWNDPTIRRENPSIGPIGLPPKLAITPIGLSEEPTMTEKVTAYLASEASGVWDYGVSQDWPIQGGKTKDVASAAEAVGAKTGAIGYADFSHVGQLFGVTRLLTPQGLFLEPNSLVTSKRLVGARVDTALSKGPKMFPVKLQAKSPAGAYPLVLVSYLIACSEYDSGRETAAANAYAKYVVSPQAQEAAAANVGSGFLPIGLRNKVLAAVD